MPQMAPISWITLYLFFSILFIVTIILNYFLFYYLPMYKTTKNKNLFLSWKW
uniref:ATP synthase F0 subunit 8 n=1 Tax=Dryocoetes hectographus TaxID=1230761 RepID=UPI001FAFFA06|nr:ATP synthase F0 subunit 8 [Dryocoetes hectographus]UJG10831.1 ATP synthase F0 subunit 8 [Dryocoetes hectographus]